MKNLRYKTSILQFLTIGLFISMYLFAIKPYVDIFNDFISNIFSSFFISFIITIIGVMIGYFFTKKPFKKPLNFDYKAKNNILTVVSTAIPILLLLVYFIFGVETLKTTALYLTKSVIILFLTVIPAFGIYSIIKKRKDMFIASSITVFVFLFHLFFLTKIFENINTSFYFENQNMFILIYFVLFICYLEIGLKSFIFDSMFKKIIPNKESENDFLLERFNTVFNSFLLYLTLFFIVSIFLSFLIINNGLSFVILKGMNSSEAIIALTFLIMIFSFIFWFFAAYDKKSKKFKFFKKIN